MLLKTCHEILVLEVIGDYCSRQEVGSVQQRVGSVHYQFKLSLVTFNGFMLSSKILQDLCFIDKNYIMTIA